MKSVIILWHTWQLTRCYIFFTYIFCYWKHSTLFSTKRIRTYIHKCGNIIPHYPLQFISTTSSTFESQPHTYFFLVLWSSLVSIVRIIGDPTRVVRFFCVRCVVLFWLFCMNFKNTTYFTYQPRDGYQPNQRETSTSVVEKMYRFFVGYLFGFSTFIFVY